MAFDLKSIQRGKHLRAPRIIVYGPHGIGKSTFGASAPNPIFLPTEDGLGTIDTASFPIAKSSADVYAAIRTLTNEQHDFQTFVLDSADWMERILVTEIEAEFDEKARSYGKDAVMLESRWQQFLESLNALRDMGMTVILIAHQEQKLVKNPETEPYERYQPKLAKRSSELVQEWADCVLFASQKVLIKQDNIGGDKTRARGIGTNKRVIFTQETPAHLAKNRYGLPAEMPLDWATLQNAIAASAV